MQQVATERGRTSQTATDTHVITQDLEGCACTRPPRANGNTSKLKQSPTQHYNITQRRIIRHCVFVGTKQPRRRLQPRRPGTPAGLRLIKSVACQLRGSRPDCKAAVAGLSASLVLLFDRLLKHMTATDISHAWPHPCIPHICLLPSRPRACRFAGLAFLHV